MTLRPNAHKAIPSSKYHYIVLPTVYLSPEESFQNDGNSTNKYYRLEVQKQTINEPSPAKEKQNCCINNSHGSFCDVIASKAFIVITAHCLLFRPDLSLSHLAQHGKHQTIFFFKNRLKNKCIQVHRESK